MEDAIARRDIVVRLPESQARALAAAAEVGAAVPDFVGSDHLETDVALAIEALTDALGGPKIVIDGDPPTFRVVAPDGSDGGTFDTLPAALEAVDIWRGLQ